MARKDNFLLGNGEKLTGTVEVPKGGGEKQPPYSFSRARVRLSQQAHKLVRAVSDLQSGACPGDEAVVTVTMHPRYVSKSDFPNTLLKSLGLRSIGSRTKKVTPENWGVEKHPTEALTEEIFAAGPRTRLLRLDQIIERMPPDSPAAEELTHVEDLACPSAEEKVKAIHEEKPAEARWLEVVLHNRGEADVFSAFAKFAEGMQATISTSRRRDIGGLTFVPVAANAETAKQLASFSFLRVARSMPALRPISPSILRASSATLTLPTGEPVTTSCRAVIFDGGIPASARPALRTWVNVVDAGSVGPSHPDFEAHGLAVTSAFLFGPIGDPNDLQKPICAVDHVRVLDTSALSSSDPYYFDVLDRIVNHLDTAGHQYVFANISMGPNVPVDDDDVTVWTAALDTRFATGNWVVTVSAGNDGDLDPVAGLNRIQPPADAVNVLTVGACDTNAALWKRASYSCPGPGRIPGFVKPDGLAFGGSDAEPFYVLSPTLGISGMQGTSVAAPYGLRSGSAVRAQLGDSLAPLAIRALMVHRASTYDGLPMVDIGWGRFESDPELLITCEDHEVLVIYQGELPIGEHMRARIPLPKTVRGMVEVKATIVITSEVDPSHASTYTRSGLEVVFRPHKDKHNQNKDGTTSHHPKSASFFSPANIYGATESRMREEGHKWETTIRGQRRMQPASLKDPCFDIYNHRREGGVASAATGKTRYTLILTVSAKKTRDLYAQVVRAYSHVLIPLRPRVRIEVKR